MKSIGKEIRNEWMKSFSWKRMLVMGTLLVLFCILMAYLSMSTDYGQDWQNELQVNIQETKALLEEAGEDLDEEIYASQIVLLTKYYYCLENNVNPNTSILSFMQKCLENNFLMIMFSIYIASEVFCTEKKHRMQKYETVRGIDVKTRLIGKIGCVFTWVLLCFVVLLLASFMIGVVCFHQNGWGLKEVFLDEAGSAYLGSFWPSVLNSMLIVWLVMIFCVLLTSLIANSFPKQLFAFGLPFLAWNFSTSIVSFLAFLPEKIQQLIFVYPLAYFNTAAMSELTWNKETLSLAATLLLYALVFFMMIYFWNLHQTKHHLGHYNPNHDDRSRKPSEG